MLIEILIAILIGCFLGIITGLTPGIHINLVSVIILSLAPFLSQYISILTLAIVIIAMSVTHTFLDALPSIFLGAPDSGMELSVLPGHKLLLEGRGYEAVVLTAIGSLFAVILMVAFAPIGLPFIKIIYPIIQKYIPYILIFFSILLIYRERKSRSLALIIFLLAGILGIITLNLQLSQPLFPLLSGLFGTSILLTSIFQKTKIPEQKITEVKLKKKEISSSMGAGFAASFLVGLLPGLGSSQAAIVATSGQKKIKPEKFLVIVGGINTFVMIVSFLALYSIDKARSGSVVVISKLLENFTINHLILFLAVSLIAAGIATWLTLKFAKIFSNIMGKINYNKLCIFIVVLITVLVTILTDWLGLLVLIVSTSIGLIPNLAGIGKNHLMGCLILPVILFFLL
ncbi:MAG: tripartite tricarboxylate transporter permease [Nanoarchaeota archaeon]